MENGELISVIIPTFNRAHLVGRAIRSVLAQRYPSVQIIVVDDGSTDETRESVARFPGVIHLTRPHGGQAAARNTGLARAEGSLIATLDSDDTWEPNFLSVCTRKLQADKLDFVFANWFQDDGHGGWKDFMFPNPYMKPFLPRAKDGWVTPEEVELRDLYLRVCPSPSSSAVIRRSSMPEGWNEQIRIGDDWCLYLDMILHQRSRAAFTFDKLWSKRMESRSVFEGCDREKLLRLLYVEDFQRFMLRYEKLLAPMEWRILEEKHLESLVELAKYRIVRRHDLKGSLRLMRDSLDRNAGYTLKTIPRIFGAGLKNRMNQFFWTLNL